MTPLLAILIPTLPERAELYKRLETELFRQIEELGVRDKVHIYFDCTEGVTTGAKRNYLVNLTAQNKVEYCCQHDDDDFPGLTYVRNQLSVAESGLDCGELWGQIYFNGVPGLPFHHSTEYLEWSTGKYHYKRTPNHLNCIRTEIMQANPFPDQVFGEDGVQSLSMIGQLKTMHRVDDTIYHYFCDKDKNSGRELPIIKQIKAGV